MTPLMVIGSSSWEGDGFAVAILERLGRVVRVDGRRCGLPLRRATGLSPLTTHVKSPGSHLRVLRTFARKCTVSAHEGLTTFRNIRILLANPNQQDFNNLVETPCLKTPYWRPHRLNLSSQPSRS